MARAAGCSGARESENVAWNSREQRVIADEPPDSEADLWFLPGPAEEAPPRAGTGRVTEWAAAEAGAARTLADLAWRLGTLEARLALGPAGWRQRLALMEAAELSWLAGDRLGADRIALWVAQRVSSVQLDPQALARAAWAFRRLTEGPGPEADLAGFLGRHTGAAGEGEALADRLATWTELMEQTGELHPVTRAAMGYWAWGFAGLDRGAAGRIEGAVVAARLAAAGRNAPAFVPLALGGGAGLRASGPPAQLLGQWLAGAEAAVLAALRHLDALEKWEREAREAIAGLSGRTPPRLVAALVEWPLLSAPMAEQIAGVSRASVHRSLDLLAEKELVREVTGQGRFRFWSARLSH
jgi:hypothetical protein